MPSPIDLTRLVNAIDKTNSHVAKSRTVISNVTTRELTPLANLLSVGSGGAGIKTVSLNVGTNKKMFWNISGFGWANDPATIYDPVWN